MNAKEISDSTLESVTPADDDLMILYDVSEGTTGKATIADIINNSSVGDIISLPTVQLLNVATGATGNLNVSFLKLRSNRGIVFCNGMVKNTQKGSVKLRFSIPNISILHILCIQGDENGNIFGAIGYARDTSDFYMSDCLGSDSIIFIRASMICNVSN